MPEHLAKGILRAKHGVFIFKDGKPVSNMVGFKPKPELKESLDAVLD